MANEITWVKDDSSKFSKETPQVRTQKSDSNTVTMWKKSFIIFCLGIILLGVLAVISGIMISKEIYNNNPSPLWKSQSGNESSTSDETYIIHFGAFKDFSSAQVFAKNLQDNHKFKTSIIKMNSAFFVISEEKYTYDAASQKINEFIGFNIYATKDKL